MIKRSRTMVNYKIARLITCLTIGVVVHNGHAHDWWNNKHKHKHSVSALYNNTNQDLYVVDSTHELFMPIKSHEFLKAEDIMKAEKVYTLSIYRSKEDYEKRKPAKLIHDFHFKKSSAQVYVLSFEDDKAEDMVAGKAKVFKLKGTIKNRSALHQ